MRPLNTLLIMSRFMIEPNVIHMEFK
uniref:Uncharacterized protein n=1 Tax=Vitis vinifera TaxID=29760 RepID=F6HVB6_VITVI